MKEREYIDVTKTLDPKMVLWPGSPGFSHHWIEKGNQHSSNLSQINLELHTGTHLDAPSHFLAAEDYIDELKLEHLIGNAQLIEFKDKRRIFAHDLISNYDGLSKKLILKCNQIQLGSDKFDEDFCALDKSAAEWIVEQGIHFVGIDYLSIQKFKDDFSVHIILLEAAVVIAENLDLSKVGGGEYHMICLPIKIKAEAAPARILLSKN